MSNQGFGFNQQQGFGFGKATTTQPFGAWQNPQQQQQQQQPFGFGQQTQAAFPTPSQTPFGGFGQAQAQTQTQTPQAGPSNAFGSAATPFGFSQTTGGFGYPSVGSSGFGFSNSQAGPSKVQTSTFGFGMAGPSNAPPSQAPTISSVQSIDPRSTGTREHKFEPYKDREPTGAIQIFQNISAMELFRPWSPEELRYYDYELIGRPGGQQPQPAQSVPSTKSFQLPTQSPFQQQQKQPVAQQPTRFFAQQQAQSQPQSQFAQQFTPFASAQPQPQPQQFALNNLPQTPATLGTLNPYNYQYTGNLYYRLHGTTYPPPLVFETKLKPKIDKGKGKEFTLQQLPFGSTGSSSAILGSVNAPISTPINDISKLSSTEQIPKSSVQVPTFSLPTPSVSRTMTMTTAQIASTPALKIPLVATPTIAVTTQPAITTGPTILSIAGTSKTKEKPKEGDPDDELEYVDLFPENKTRTTPLPPEECKKVLTAADFPRRKRREPIYHSGVLTLKDIKEPTWGYDKSYRRVVPKIHNVGDSGKNLLEQLKTRDRNAPVPNTTEANKKKVPGSEVPPESDVDARLVYELLLKPRRDGPYAYREEYDGTWSPLYGDGRDEKPKWEPIRWKQQKYYKEYVKDVKRTKFPITEERYEAPSWWDNHPYKPVPKELTKDMDQYDLSHEAFVEDIVVKMGLRPDPPKAQIDALKRQVIVKLVRVQKKPVEWTETKLVTEPNNCCGAMVQKLKEEKMHFNKLYNPLIGGFESQPESPNQPWVFVYAALPGEFEDRTPSYAELLNKYKSGGIPQRNMYILDAPPRMPRVDFSKIIEGEIEFSKIVKEDVHKICHQDKKCDCSYAKKEPEVKQATTIPRSHFYCYERLGKKPREDKPTIFQKVHGYQPFSKHKTPEPEENKPTKIHRILVPPQDDDDF